MTKDAVLSFLREEGGYLSGEKISRRLGISRAAVNAAVKALRLEGYEILSATNKGYCLSAVPDSLSEKELGACLGRERMERVACFDAVDSTNNRLRELALAGAPDGQVVIANEQRSGRGRRGRTFLSPRDKGIYLSMLFCPESLPGDTAEITAWTAVAVNNAVETVCGIRAGIKWVNDLVLGRKKVCGILTELSVEGESGYVQYLILGIGINVNETREDFPESIREAATSLAAETGQNYPRARLAAEIIRELDDMRGAWPREKARFLEAYRADDITVGKEIRLVRNGVEIPCAALGVNGDFSLEVFRADGSRQKISSGEVSVRGIYGKN